MSFLEEITQLHKFHLDHSAEYKRIINLLYKNNNKKFYSSADIPFLPVRFFKEYELKSIPLDSIYKTMYSSGTSGKKSKIFLDKQTSQSQTRTLLNLGKKFLGDKRLPMLVFENSSIEESRNNFSARIAGINGFRIFSKKVFYILNEHEEINQDQIIRVLDEFPDSPIFLFGFTSVIWNTINNLKQFSVFKKFKQNMILIHGGGWKKLSDRNYTNDDFKKMVYEKISNKCKVINYYGMIEQTGSIFFECPEGRFHETEFSEILIRDLNNFQVIDDERPGLIQLNSLIPESYPGHAILSEDIGIRYNNHCKCGNYKNSFNILGRVPRAEVRGCSDATT